MASAARKFESCYLKNGLTKIRAAHRVKIAVILLLYFNSLHNENLPHTFSRLSSFIDMRKHIIHSKGSRFLIPRGLKRLTELGIPLTYRSTKKKTTKLYYVKFVQYKTHASQVYRAIRKKKWTIDTTCLHLLNV